LTNFDRVSQEYASLNNEFIEVLDGNVEDWCFYFEKADLASQNQDWITITSLWNEAKKGGHAPLNGVEYRPFIQGFAYTGNWEKAKNLTMYANSITGYIGDYYCELWNEFERNTQDKNDVIEDVLKKLDCRQ